MGGCFSDGGAYFSVGGRPMGSFDGGGISKKIVGWGEGALPIPPTMGNPACICYQNMHVNYFFHVNFTLKTKES